MRRPARWAAAAVLLGALLRFATLDQQSFWLDEAYTVRFLSGSLDDTLRVLPEWESAPPVYYVLAWTWGQVLGFGESGLRSLSALSGTLTIPVAYAIGARLATPLTGVVAAGLVAVHPLLVWFSQEARAYSLVVLFASLSLLFFLHVLDGAQRRSWAWWAACSALAVATHYFAGFLVLAEAAWLAWRVPRDRRMAVAFGAVAATVLALAPLALAQRSSGHAAYIGEGDLASRLLQVPKQLLTGYASPLQTLSTVVVAVLVAGALARLARGRDARALLPVWLTAGTVGVPLLLVLTGQDYLNTRNVIVALPALLVAVAAGLTGLTTRSPRAAVAPAVVLGAVLLAVTVAVASEERFQRDDWRSAAAALGPPSGTRAVVVSPGSGWIALELYRDGLRPLPATPTAVSEVDVVAIARRSETGGREPAPEPPETPVLPANLRAISTQRDATATVVRYATMPTPFDVDPPTLAPAALWKGDGAVMLLPR
jgi:mannosyltransferase